jgi:hypothetical protein
LDFLTDHDAEVNVCPLCIELLRLRNRIESRDDLEVLGDCRSLIGMTESLHADAIGSHDPPPLEIKRTNLLAHFPGLPVTALISVESVPAKMTFLLSHPTLLLMVEWRVIVLRRRLCAHALSHWERGRVRAAGDAHMEAPDPSPLPVGEGANCRSWRNVQKFDAPPHDEARLLPP